MTGRRARLWRWAVVGWAVAVAVSGGLTLWLRDAAAPPEPYGWYEETPSPTPPSPRWDDGENPCQDDRSEHVFCVYATARLTNR